jgi:hypothetical protein
VGILGGLKNETIKKSISKHLGQEAKLRKGFRQRAIATGTVAAITFGAGVGVNQ